MSRKIDVTIVIVSWNVSELLKDCIKSLYDHLGNLVIEIIIVDNNSSDDSVQMVKREFPNIRIIVNKSNRGFALANNQAFEIAEGKYIFILNPDTLILENSIQKLVTILETYGDIGMVGPKLIYPNGEIQSECARLLPTLSFKLFHDILKVQKIPLIGKLLFKKYFSAYSYKVGQNVEAISGAAMLVRSEILFQLNGFGKNFIFAGEDVDLCFRTRKTGWYIYYEPQSVVIHLFGQSRKNNRPRTIINGAISQQEYLLRNYGKIQAFLFRIIILFIEIPIIIFVGVIKYIIRKETFMGFRTRLSIVKGLFIWHEM